MHRQPGSQTRALLQEKEQLVHQLLDRGLTMTQICAQLNCSRGFVRRITREHTTVRMDEAS